MTHYFIYCEVTQATQTVECDVEEGRFHLNDYERLYEWFDGAIEWQSIGGKKHYTKDKTGYTHGLYKQVHEGEYWMTYKANIKRA